MTSPKPTERCAWFSPVPSQMTLEFLGSMVMQPIEYEPWLSKIDFQVTDALGRKWQLSTIQCDFNLPERFDLHYAAEDGSLQRPVMIHRAIFGSLERFLAVLIEHTGTMFVKDGDGRLRLLWKNDTPVADMEHDIRLLLEPRS